MDPRLHHSLLQVIVEEQRVQDHLGTGWKEGRGRSLTRQREAGQAKGVKRSGGLAYQRRRRGDLGAARRSHHHLDLVVFIEDDGRTHGRQRPLTCNQR